MYCIKGGIYSFPNDVFSMCQSVKPYSNELQSVRVNNNSITELNIADLLKFPKATEFDFSFNELKTVSGSSIGEDESFKSIKTLKFGQNTPFEIVDGSLDGFFQLTKLDLRGNITGNYTSKSWPFCHSKVNQKDFQKRANVYYDYESELTEENETSYCDTYRPNGTL